MDGATDPIANQRATAVPVMMRVGGWTLRATPERSWSIGRAREADVCLDDPRISRRHATLEHTPDGWVLVSDGANGMFFDGRRVKRLVVHRQVTVSLEAESRSVILQLEAQPLSTPDAAIRIPDRSPAQPAPLSPANWYPDPAGSGRLRYFNDTEWTDHYSAVSTPQQQPPGAAGTGYQAGLPGPWDADVFQIRLTKHTGLLLLWQQRSYLFTGTFQEGERVYHEAQNYNLAAGWWSVTSALLLNWVTLFSNRSAMR